MSDLKFIAGSAFGVRIQGRLPDSFSQYLWNTATNSLIALRPIDVQYRIISHTPELEEFWFVENKDSQAPARFSLSRHERHLTLKVDCQGQGLFHIGKSNIDIDWVPGGTGAAHYFFSYALPLWLELQNIPVLHASAVKIGEHTVAFLGRSGMGKSTLCDGLVRCGHQFIADDGLALIRDESGVWHCASGPPLIRLWPSNLKYNPDTRIDQLVRVHDAFEKRVVPVIHTPPGQHPGNPPLSTIYILDRNNKPESPVSISPLRPAASVMHLIEQTMLGAPVKALGLAASRLESLADIVSNSRVARLSYPGKFSNFKEIAIAIQQHN